MRRPRKGVTRSTFASHPRGVGASLGTLAAFPHGCPTEWGSIHRDVTCGNAVAYEVPAPAHHGLAARARHGRALGDRLRASHVPLHWAASVHAVPTSLVTRAQTMWQSMPAQRTRPSRQRSSSRHTARSHTGARGPPSARREGNPSGFRAARNAAGAGDGSRVMRIALALEPPTVVSPASSAAHS